MKRSSFKIVAVVLTILIGISGISLTGFASGRSHKLSGFSGKDTLDEMWALGTSKELDSITVYPGDEIVIPLTANMFKWDDGRTPLKKQAVRISDIRRDVSVRTEVQAGWEALDYVQLDTDMVPGRPFYLPYGTGKTGRTTVIDIMFAENLPTVDDIEFRLDIYLTANGEKDEDYRITLHGKMVHEKIDVSATTKYVDISDGSVAVADDAAIFKDLTEFDLGNGVKVSKLLWKNKKYYGTAAYKPSTSLAVEEFPTIYPVIHGVYQLSTENISAGVNRVKITPELDPQKPDIKDFHVYNNDMEYLGTTKDTLPFSDMYILTYRELDSFETSSYVDNLEDEPTQIEETKKNTDISINPATVSNKTKKTVTGEKLDS